MKDAAMSDFSVDRTVDRVRLEFDLTAACLVTGVDQRSTEGICIRTQGTRDLRALRIRRWLPEPIFVLFKRSELARVGPSFAQIGTRRPRSDVL